MIQEATRKIVVESFSSLAVSMMSIMIPIIIILGIMRIILDRVEGTMWKMVKKNRKNSRK